MDPDEEHAKYFAEHPQGDHDMPAPETLRFMGAQVLINKENRENVKEMSDKVDAVNDKVTTLSIETATQTILLKSIDAQTKKTNGWINKHAEEDACFKESFLPILKELKENKAYTNQKLKDWKWRWLEQGLVALIVVVLTLLGVREYLIKFLIK